MKSACLVVRQIQPSAITKDASQLSAIAGRLLPQAISPATLRLIQSRIEQNLALLG